MQFLTDFHVCASVNALSATLTGWTCAAANAPDDASWTFRVPDGDAFATDFWAQLVRPYGTGLEDLDAGDMPVQDLIPNCPGAACLAGFHGGMPAYWIWLDGSHMPEPDVEIRTPDDGVLVYWTKNAEARLGIMDALVSFVIQNGFALEPEED